MTKFQFSNSGLILKPFKAIAVLVMALLLCVPCEAKREIKLLVNAPVGAPVQKSNNASICAVGYESVRKTAIAVRQRGIQPFSGDFNILSSLSGRVSSSLIFYLPVFSERVSVAVPVFILHEQYRI